MTRTSIRAYTADSISKENIETMLRAAMAAPSAGNKQPRRFVVVENRATLDSIGANFRINENGFAGTAWHCGMR